MAGAYVFPGGQLEETDNDPQLENYIKTADVIDPCGYWQDSSLPREKSAGIFLFAASGKLSKRRAFFLGGKTTGKYVSFHDEKVLKRFNDYRRELNSSQLHWRKLPKRKYFLFPDTLIPYSHWITPEFEKKEI